MMGGYVKNGPVGIARELFNEMPERDTFSWNMTITEARNRFDWMPERDIVSRNMTLAMFFHKQIWGRLDNGLCVHSFIENNKIKCDGLLPTALLTMYANSGAMDLARDVFDNMPDKNEIEPKVEQFGCMFDLLSLVGLMEQSNRLMSKMLVELGPSLWRALLSACRTLSNLELRKIIAKPLIDLEQMDVVPYVLLSYIYSLERKLGEDENIRKFITDREFSERMYMKVEE
ncbi:hypothetical protein V6N11_084046 [Hibiscus sabdariffa]|uniref:Pentatricopeptide repeat-containing protein n=1 Tax=Hibiscus sabdariffa TaxID=183260 RepID=A0ABR2QD86_9ROSI